MLGDNYILNPCEEFVIDIKKRVKDNNGYCIYSERRSKNERCPKYCKKTDASCECGMYVESDLYQTEEDEMS